jgi:Xaa-Pro aminopeptidase
MLLNRDRADALMDQAGVSAIVTATPLNTFYVSGWSTYAAWGFGDMALAVLPRDHGLEPAVITPEADTAQPQQRDGTWMKIVRPYRRKPGIGPAGRQAKLEGLEPIPADHSDAVGDYLKELGLIDAKVAFEDRGLGLDVKAYSNSKLEVAPGRDLLRDIRMVKTPEEVRLLRAATRKTEIGLLAAAEAVAGGATCSEAERVFWQTVTAVGGFPMFLLITPYRPGVGRLPKTAVLQPGDCVTFDSTGEFEHYSSDVGRTAIIGEPTKEQLRRYNAMRRGWTNSLQEFKPGVNSGALERIVVKHIQDAGNPDFTGASIHGVGLEHTDHPHPNNSLAPFDLIDGSVLSCDLPWTDPAIGRFHLEDLAYLKDGKVELLNDPDTRIFACIDGRTVRVE